MAYLQKVLTKSFAFQFYMSLETMNSLSLIPFNFYRYSDFHDFYQKIKEKYYDLAKIPFPAKKAFHNMDRSVLERRMIMLNAWLVQLTKPTVVDGHMGLQNLLLSFLEQGDYDKGVTGGHIAKTVRFSYIFILCLQILFYFNNEICYIIFRLILW